MELLEVKNLSKHYKNFDLKDISFSLPKGYIMGYVGANGSGKTTTLNLITGILKGTEGEVRIDGLSHEEDMGAYKEKIGYVGDESYFPDHFKIKHIRSILKDFYPTFSADKFNGFIRKWKLPENKMIKDFSRGMKVMLMFASVLARETKLLVLDEASNGLDPVMRAEVLRLLQEYVMDGERSVIFSTHILSDLEQIADYIYFIHAGRTVFYDAKDDLIENFLLVKGESARIPPALKRELIGLEENAYGFEAVLPSDKAELLGNAFLFEKPTIDQIVIHYIKNKDMDTGKQE
ncbi:MAG: ABC transporter ATP-binding protein [Lachnospiraceae bacterium]|nr:ABC transporter ATP-binding protein [Lachnospiraceae bacterium]